MHRLPPAKTIRFTLSDVGGGDDGGGDDAGSTGVRAYW